MDNNTGTEAPSYGPRNDRTALDRPCPHCRVDAGVECWPKSPSNWHTACRDNPSECANTGEFPAFPKEIAPESERHLKPTFTFTNEYAIHVESAYRSPNIVPDDTEALMTAMARAGRFLNTRFEAAAVSKMLAGQREHGEGTWRSVDLWRYAADEPLDIRNYVALLVERGQMVPHDANLIVQKAEDILTLLEDAKGGNIL